MMRKLIALAILCALGVAGGACSKSTTSTTTAAPSPVGGTTVSDAWARESVAVANAGAVYMTITNSGSSDDSLISASVNPSIAMSAELHETVTQSSTETATTPTASPTGMTMHAMGSDMSTSPTSSPSSSMGSSMTGMRQVASIPIPAGKTVQLQPGGYHIMLIGLTAPLNAGASIDLTLTFANAGKRNVTAQVRAA